MAGETTPKPPQGSETILLIDDEEAIVAITKQLLERLGYKVEAQTNPIKALELFKLNPARFDLAIIDILMSEMTGAALSKRMLEVRSDIPIIISTGHSSLMDEKKAKELRAAAYIMKPFGKQEIAKIIRQVLDQTKKKNT